LIVCIYATRTILMTALSFIQVEIDGFRGLRSLNLDGLGRVNILVGRNNSGKTSVLEALSILCQPQNPDEWLAMVRRRDFGGLDETVVQSLRWCFAQATALTDPEKLIESTCQFKCNGSFPLRELNISYSEFKEPSPKMQHRSPYGWHLEHVLDKSIIWDMMLDEEIMSDEDMMLDEELMSDEDMMLDEELMSDEDMMRYEKMMRDVELARRVELMRGAARRVELMRGAARRAELARRVELVRGAELVHVPVWLKQPSGWFDWLLKSNQQIDEEAKVLRVFEDISLSTYRKEIKSPWLDCKTLTPYSYQTNSYQLQAQSKRIFQDDSPTVLELLKDFDADVEGIDMASFSGNRAAIYIKHRKLGVAPLSVFGDAMRRAVLLAATLPSLKKGGILLIDEVEAGIHVGALTNVFTWLVKAARKLEIQIFVTTHSLEALDALISTNPEQVEDDIVAFHLTQTEEGTQCKRFSGDLLHRLRFERGLDVR
jgi:predicted ATPase